MTMMKKFRGILPAINIDFVKTNFCYVLSLFVLALFPACAGAMPQEVPSDLKIEFGRDGGMQPIGEDLRIEKGVMVYEASHYNNKAGFTTQVSPEEVSQLYALVRDNHFDKIRLEDGLVHDKQGEHLRVSWGSEQIYLGTSGAEVEKRWSESWKLIIKEFDAFIETKAKAFRKPLTVILDKNLAGRYAVVTLSERNVVISQVPAEGYSQTLYLLPGKYQVSAYTIRDYDPKKYMEWAEVQKRRGEADLLIDVPETQRIRVFADGTIGIRID